MTRRVRLLAMLVGLAALVSLLAACSKPLPKITVQSVRSVYTLGPLKYCGYDLSKCRSGDLHLTFVKAGIDDRVLLDVPRQVKSKGWTVNALSLQQKAIGTSGTIKNSHSYRVAANANNGAPFIVQVNELHKGQPDGSVWSFVVQVTTSTG